ncbi:MAG: N-(5'-phosphoribosyl)anthranilate isomerase [Candidatus Magnetoglobus multicellularis str. Araruama]|uniref:N-(5'-phosphoribosyl)anthranilate isomerase n=1 Tax=Candidatus Magnetoglobus multicellularis str. Araruama TaxID=890399 RepID=A0A1V1PAC0_9BACT|nr:MAG: N-(5'-phosphoribosyl)anthranilate isomerase [Candidatus Magnetoglobus multicellularis str. Araruama]
MAFIKICGITNIQDAQAAIDMGADALGFVFAESPRKVSPETVQTIIARLPSDRLYIGVFVNHSLKEMLEIKTFCGIDTVQIHDEKALDFSVNQGFKIIMGLRVKPNTPVPGSIDPNVILLLDTYSKDAFGGTGKTFDWQKAVSIAKQRPIILAGGLTPDNVIHAIETVHPFAVDVSSGVEKNKGQKDHGKMKAFIHNVRKTTIHPSAHKSMTMKAHFTPNIQMASQ